MRKFEVVFISTPGIGNFIPTVEFAKRLTNHDSRFSATVLIITRPQRQIVDTYIQSLTATTTTNIRFVHLPTVDPPSPDDYQSTFVFTALFIEKHKLHVKHALTNLMSTESSSNSVQLAGLFVDMFCISMIDVANELNIPCYLFFASPASFLGFMLHLPILDTQLSELNSEFEDSDTELAIPSFVNPVPLLVLPPLLRKKDVYFWFSYYAGRYKETKGIVVNTFRELEIHALDSISSTSQVPPVYPVGPVLDLIGPAQWHPDRAHEETIMKWLDDQPQSSVVFLCFGSMGSLSPAQVREIAFGLEQAGYRFLWTLREPPKALLDLPSDYTNPDQALPSGFLERTAGIGLVCGWAPQVSILAHWAIGGFVSHCGWNSILESLWYGVPIATWPIYAEQHMNAFEMVKELGLAVEIRVDYRDGSDLVLAEEVERGVRRVMDSDAEIRRKVKDMGEKSRKAVMENGSSFTSLGFLIEELVAKI